VPARPITIGMNKGFTLIELLIVISIVGIIGGFGFINLFGAAREGELANTRVSIAALLRDAQQRSISQVDGRFWGVRFENQAGRDQFFLFSTSQDPFSDITVYEQHTLVTTKSFLEFRQPSSGTTLTVDFDQVTGELALNSCPNVTVNSTIEIGLVGGSDSLMIKVFCNGKIEF